MQASPQSYSSERQQVIDWLIAHNYPALPVAPAQDARQYHKIVKALPLEGIWEHCPLTSTLEPIPIFTGKNPSYLDKNGKPHNINHRQYQRQLPSKRFLKEWFANPANGVGTLGGWNSCVWLDFDVKQFPSQQECDAAVRKILEKPELQQTFIERSHSGGWRIGITVKQKPNFTNFSLTPGGVHVGEALFEGRFTVLAPTVGPSGNPYQSLNRALPVEVESLESIGIYSIKKDKPQEIPQRVGAVSPRAAYIPGSIDLALLGNDTSRDILNGADPSCDRSYSLATAIQEWYGWINWGRENGIPISGDAETLAHQAGIELGLSSDRVNRILKTIDPTSCQPAALYRGGEDSCWKKVRSLDKATFEAKCPAHIKAAIAREWGGSSGNNGGDGDSGRRSGGAGGSGSGGDGGDGGDSKRKIIKLPFDASLNTTAIRSQIKEILTQVLSPSQLEEALIRLRVENPALTEREVNRLFDEISKELELEDLSDERRAGVDNLLKLGDQSLCLSDFLPPDLAQPLNRLSEFMNVRPEVALTSLLVAASSLHKTQTELVINRGQDFRVVPTIFAGLVAESGQKKSPILKAIVRKPLSVLQREKREAHEQALAQYEQDIAAWDKCKASERESKFPNGKPKKPQQRLYYFTNTTGEGLLYQFQAHPDKALLALVDELVALFTSQNKYSGGRGSDKQDLLSAFDGTGATLLRADGAKADLDGLLLSIFGTIQPEILKQLMKDCSDPDGQWARFLFVNQPLAASTLPDEDSGGFDLTSRLLGYYRRIDRLAPREYRLSREAYKRYKPVYDQLERLRVAHPNSGMRAVYSKMAGYIGRLALNLHVLWELSAGKSIPDEQIPLAIMEMAIALAKFFIGQVRLLHVNADEADLVPYLAKLIQRSKLLESIGQDGWVRDRDYQRLFNRQPRVDVARSWMREASALGFGRTRPVGRRGLSLEFHWRGGDDNSPTPPHSPDKDFVSAVSAVSALSVESLTNVPLENEGRQQFVSAVSAEPTSFEDPFTPQTLHVCGVSSLIAEAVKEEPPLTTLTNASELEPVGDSSVSDGVGQTLAEGLTEPVVKPTLATLRATVAVCEAAVTALQQPAQLNIYGISEPIPERPRSFSGSAQEENARSQQQSQSASPAVHSLPLAPELEHNERVRYCGNNPDWQHYKRLTLTVVGLKSKSSGSAAYDMITCRLPGGGINDFLRYTLRKAE